MNNRMVNQIPKEKCFYISLPVTNNIFLKPNIPMREKYTIVTP